MIRPEAHQWNWKPKTRSKDDMKLDKDLEILRKKLGLRKDFEGVLEKGKESVIVLGKSFSE